MDEKAVIKKIGIFCRVECHDIFCYFDGAYFLAAYFFIVLVAGKCDYGYKEIAALILSAVAAILGVIFHFAVKKFWCRHCR